MSAIEAVVGPAPVAFVRSLTNAAATITITPSPDFPNLYLDGFLISASAAPASPITTIITGPAGTTPTGTAAAGTAMPIEIPASAFAPIGFLFNTRPIPMLVNTSGGVSTPQPLVVSVPALGSGVFVSLWVFYHVGV